ncbi:hypothetical protein HY003_01680 [Candidatus Saccharibacteria bacterium]|nr:hypothetical protein [Candidatus Saccharibacteria bacterium]MBI3337986.1 hypothetical protein [Candidatus Saccharibacteria bacterium]
MQPAWDKLVSTANWTCRKTPPSPDRILSATNSFSSLDVATATSPSDKTVFAQDNSLWERTILRQIQLSSVKRLRFERFSVFAV